MRRYKQLRRVLSKGCQPKIQAEQLEGIAG
jgi:hypothetical protein